VQRSKIKLGKAASLQASHALAACSCTRRVVVRDISKFAYHQQCAAIPAKALDKLVTIVSVIGWACDDCKESAKTAVNRMQIAIASLSEEMAQMKQLTYAERLAVLNLETLELRRLRFDLIFNYKVFSHLTPFDPDVVFTIYSPPSCLRSNEPFILKPITVPNKFLSTTFCRAVDAWNYLPIDLRLSKSLPVFIRGLEVVDFSKFLKGSVNLNWLHVYPWCY
jgi:hypothetical protein